MMPTVYLGPEEGRAEWDALQAAQANRAQILADCAAGLDAVRQALGTLDGIIAAAGPIERYDPGTKTATQILADVVPAVKQLATGVRLLAEGEKLALGDIVYLARLALGQYDGTD
jgi:hypothetical protein